LPGVVGDSEAIGQGSTFGLRSLTYPLGEAMFLGTWSNLLRSFAPLDSRRGQPYVNHPASRSIYYPSILYL
jgi:hypothetical protein